MTHDLLGLSGDLALAGLIFLVLTLLALGVLVFLRHVVMRGFDD